MKNLIDGMLEKNHRFRIDDYSEMFNKWFEFKPIRKHSTIIIGNISKEFNFENPNKSNDSINNINNNINQENNHINNDQNYQNSNIVRGKSLKTNNKFKLFCNINNNEKKIGYKQNGMDNESNIKNKYSKFKKIIENLNVNLSSNAQEIENNNNNKQLILPALSSKKIKNKNILSPFKTKTDMKKNSILIKPNLPIYGNNLFKKKYDIKNDINKNTLILNKNESINNYNGYSSNYSTKKRATSDFKNKILQTINGNNLFNNNKNIVNNNIPNTFKNINTPNITSFNESPIKRNKFKSLYKNNRNISSYEISKFPLIIE